MEHGNANRFGLCKGKREDWPGFLKSVALLVKGMYKNIILHRKRRELITIIIIIINII